MDGLASLAAAADLFDSTTATTTSNDGIPVSPLKKRKRIDGAASSPVRSNKPSSNNLNSIVNRTALSRAESIGKAVSRSDSFNSTNNKNGNANICRDNPVVNKLMGVLKHCRGIRKWCQYEFFYSTMDRAYFMENEFLSCLKLLKLDQLVPLSSKELDSVPSVKKQKLLTRSEWNAVKHLICREIGRPRRFSPNFLAAEREKLSRYRYMVRFIQNYKHNPEVVTKESQAIVDIIKSFPYNIASPCNVGDCVTVFCKDTDQLQRGQILMVLSSSSDTKESNKHNNCASQKDGINNLQEEGDTSNDINSTNDTEQSNTTLIDKKYYRVQFEQSNVQDSLFEDYDICIHGK